MNNAAGDPLVGKTVAQYEVVARLGGGGMGVVYAARDTKLGRRVALKFLPPQWSHDEGAKQRFIREAQAASSTDHRNICTIHDIGAGDDGQLFIVMAHYEGETLKQRLESAALPVDEAVEIAAQVAEGLAKAHAQGVVHRDIKPANLMLTEDGVKILDFGLAKFAEARFKLTLEGSTIGTIAYMSPEQTRGEDADARSDVWAIGVVLYEMLAGAAPFKGGYPEAIAHAIKHDPPPPLRGYGEAGTALRGHGEAGTIPEALEQIVFRALHKNPAVRFQSARDLARALRQMQGRTVPLDLRTEALPLVDVGTVTGAHPSTRRRLQRRTLAAAAVLAALLVGVPLWVFAPIERVPVAVAPVVNQTGYAELDAYRLALTQELIAQLTESRTVLVVPYERLLQIVRRYRTGDGDVSSREALQAIAAQAGVDTLVVPTLLYEDGAWKARVEFRNTGTATNAAIVETDPVVSSLMKETAHVLTASLAPAIHAHITSSASLRVYVSDAVRRLTARTPAARPRLRTLDAAAAFEQGVDAYEQQEHSVALRAFTAAAEQDPLSPLVFAWKSRVARAMRRDGEAADAAEQAARLLTDQTPAADRLFAEALVAESRRDFATAEARYRALISRFPDDPAWLVELAGFQDRRVQTAAAVATYRQALTLDARLARPRLELCRLYAPFRLNDPPSAKEQGGLALATYRTLGARAGEAQTLWCLIDVLRAGTDANREEARRHADEAIRIFETLGYEYNVARAHNYAALAAESQGRLTEAVAFWERSLVGVRNAGNVGLEPTILNNLGVTYEAIGDLARAVRYRDESYKILESLGDEQRAAQSLANLAALRIEYGDDVEQGLRDVQNAIAVVRKLEDRNFEVFCLQVMAAYYRYAGRHAEAERALNQALAIAGERNLDDEIARSTIDIARSRFDVAAYADARRRLEQRLGNGSTPERDEIQIHLARTETRVGDFDAARTRLATAGRDLNTGGARALLPLLHTALGEVAYESGRFAEARTHFEASSRLWVDGSLPFDASVEARAYLGLLDGLQGRADRGRAALRASLDQARKMGRLSLEARCRLFLARLDLAARQFRSALATLDLVPADDDTRTVGSELRGLIVHARAEALAGLGNGTEAVQQFAIARKLLEGIQGSLPGDRRASFARRPDVQRIIG